MIVSRKNAGNEFQEGVNFEVKSVKGLNLWRKLDVITQQILSKDEIVISTLACQAPARRSDTAGMTGSLEIQSK